MKLYSCPFCKKKYTSKDALYIHMEREHKDELHGLSAKQIYFNWKNHYALTKGFGRSIMSGLPTPFNLTTCRYEQFANKKEIEEYVQRFRRNMKNKYGKETLMNDPEQQKKMLANKKISGIYEWANGSKTSYVGSYEKKFLEYLELTLGWDNPEDIIAPAPMVIRYKDSDGKDHFHIPDFFITSMNMIVNIKSSTGFHLKHLEAEQTEDKLIGKSKYNYIKIYDNKFEKFTQAIETLKKSDMNKKITIY